MPVLDLFVKIQEQTERCDFAVASVTSETAN